MKNLMEARDSVSGSLAECYVTLTGRRYCLMQLTEFESKWGITLTDVPILGRVQKGSGGNMDSESALQPVGAQSMAFAL